MTIALRDLSTATLMANLFAGTRVAYATFFGYDEVAHHSGIERGDAFRTLRAIDRQFARLERAAALGPRPYEFVVLADHGQSQGATFLQRYGLTLEEVVRGALIEPHTAGDMGPAEEARAGVGSALTEVVRAEYGKFLSAEELERIGKDLQDYVPLLARLRAVKLVNADEPDFP